MAKKPKATIYKLRGTAVYPRITNPDTKYNTHGNYTAKTKMKIADAQPSIKQLQEIAKRHIGKPLPLKKNACWFYEKITDDETGEETETGFVVFNLTAKNRMVKDKKTKEERLWDRKPAVFSASGKPANKAKIGGGTEWIVSFEVYEGKDADGNPVLALQPVAVQIIKLVEFKSGGGDVDPSQYGIDAVEGWEPDDEDESDDDSQDDDDTSDDEGSDDGDDTSDNDDF